MPQELLDGSFGVGDIKWSYSNVCMVELISIPFKSFHDFQKGEHSHIDYEMELVMQ